MCPRPVPRQSKRGRNEKPVRFRNGMQDQELHDDPERGTEAEQQLLGAGVATDGGPGSADQRGVGGAGAAEVLHRTESPQVGGEHEHGDHVVGDRRPHHRAEGAACVEHLADEHEHPVEEDLRQAVARERDHGLALRRQLGAEEAAVEEQPHQHRRTDHEHRGDAGQEHGSERDDPVGVAVPAVGVELLRPDQLRHQHGVEDPAGQQDVEHVRDRVGDREHVGVQGLAQRRGEQGAAHEAAEPRDHRAGGHDGAGGEDARVGAGVGPARRSGHAELMP